LQELEMKVFTICFASLYFIVVPGAHGADAEAGRRLARIHCAGCHIVDQSPSNEVAQAPPFPVIGRKYDFNSDSLVAALAGPHPKMNFSVRGRDADDIAAYIVTLKR
jgi:mono/diheme cytochrome c family protein